jgi:hypothetical protein
MWEQKTSGNKSDSYNWKDALAYCEELLLGGHDDWRLPNPKEIERSVDLETSSPAVDTTYFPNTNNALYWTGTTCSGCHKMKAFAIDYTDGELYYGNKFKEEVYYENFIRCVRTTDAPNTTTTTATATTTTVPNQTCPSALIYGEASDKVQLLRSFRDTILSKTPEGQEIIKLYYEWSPVITKVMEEDEEFKGEIKEMIDGVLLVIRRDVK